MLVVIARSCNPFSADRGARLYKTGDLARYRSDVTIEFAGRPDDQIHFVAFATNCE
jgi:non-ribosomal peptide synthetase component F